MKYAPILGFLDTHPPPLVYNFGVGFMETDKESGSPGFVRIAQCFNRPRMGSTAQSLVKGNTAFTRPTAGC